MTEITLTINGSRVSRSVTPRTHLADFLREDLNLTGTHIGCEHGVCGACTLMIDGRPMRSCITYAASCGDADIRTVEGFDDDPVMEALRQAFNRRHALQCGYCTPGMLATAYDIVRRLPDADEAMVRAELAGNLCRCTGYAGIVAAIQDVLAARLEAPLQPLVRPPLSTMVGTTVAGPMATRQAQVEALAVSPLPDRIEGGFTLSRSLTVEVPVDAVWRVLTDIPTIARCLPGAEIEAIGADGLVEGAFTVAIGPMRVRFRGRAQVAFDADRRSGSVRGSGGDGASRSRADGMIAFAVAEDAGQAVLSLDITYRLNGPLSQFGRPAVINAAVDHVLAQFAANLVAVAQGGQAVAAAPVGGIRLVWAMLRRLWGR